MSISRVLSVAVVVTLLVGGRPAAAEEWSFGQLNPLAKRDSAKTPENKTKKPSPLEKLDAGVKRFFAKTGELLKLKKPAARQPAYKRHYPWNRQPRSPRLARRPKPPSWFPSLFRHEQPKVPKSLDDWMSLKRQDP